jgi:hypothetical protein
MVILVLLKNPSKRSLTFKQRFGGEKMGIAMSKKYVFQYFQSQSQILQGCRRQGQSIF